MTRMLKALGLSFVAVLALSAMAATAAQAHKFVGEGVLTGTNEAGTQDAFTVGNNVVECEDSHFVATQATSPTESLTVVPLYQNAKEEAGKCHYGENAATVRVNHCAYVFSSNTEVTTEGQEHAHVGIECATENDAEEPVSNEIEIEVPGAFVLLHVAAQEGTTHGVVYTNIEEEGHKAVTVNATVKNIATTCTGFGCAIIGGNNLTGEYNSTDIVTGYEDTGESLKGKTAATTQSSYSMGTTPTDIEVEGAP